MKKAFALVLLVTLLVSLAVPVSAVNSPAAAEKDLTPVLVSSDVDTFAIVTPEEATTLSENAQETFVKAKEELAEAVPEGMVAKYYFYCVTDKTCSVVFDIDDVDELVIKQYVDGEWIELTFTINDDGTITVAGVVDGPMAIFVK